MSLEIERKFKVENSWVIPQDATGTPIRQAYLTAPEASVEFRVRQYSGSHLMTAKSDAGSARAMIREEIEFEIPADIFRQLWQLAGSECLSKRRFAISVGAHTAAVDVYEGPLAGLRVAEVEFSSAADADAFVPPPWFGEEITGIAQWGNRQLAHLAGERENSG